jgi:hypothetical protein
MIFLTHGNNYTKRQVSASAGFSSCSALELLPSRLRYKLFQPDVAIREFALPNTPGTTKLERL